MIYLQEDPKEFARKYQIQIKNGNCSKCDGDLIPTKPFSLKGYRGIESEKCKCGSGYSSSCIVPVGEKIIFWKGILE